MPWGYECRQKFLKQFPPKPTQPRSGRTGRIPGPMDYETPVICGGNGYSHINKAPAYSFGMRTPISFCKPPYTATAKMFNVQHLTEKGPYRIPNGIIAQQLIPLTNKTNVPGPGAYEPKPSMTIRRPPAYSLRSPAKPLYQPWDMWTPGPNQYQPPILRAKKMPAYSIRSNQPTPKGFQAPAPGAYDADYKYVMPRPPAFSFAQAAKPSKIQKRPDPNTYCEKKFKYVDRSMPAFSFGIKHSQYRGEFKPHLITKKIDTGSVD